MKLGNEEIGKLLALAVKNIEALLHISRSLFVSLQRFVRVFLLAVKSLKIKHKTI